MATYKQIKQNIHLQEVMMYTSITVYGPTAIIFVLKLHFVWNHVIPKEMDSDICGYLGMCDIERNLVCVV